MATYAAYRHVELDKVGYGKRSIMKPPGGDCHDIFGADFHGTPSHHRVLKPPGGGTSQLFSAPEEIPKPRMTHNSDASIGQASLNGIDSAKTGNDFEDPSVPDIRGQTEPELLSSFSSEIRAVPSQEGRANIKARNCVTGEGCQTNEHYFIRVHKQRDGNPVTGEGYDHQDSHAQPAPPTRTRVPPGGYSSGLW